MANGMSPSGYRHEKEKSDDLKMVVLKHSLQNAVQHGGKASPGSVIGKVLAEKPDYRGRINEVREEAEKAVKSVNFSSIEEQKRRLVLLVPEAAVILPKGEKEGLPELKNAVMGKVVTRFAPCPSGPINVLHVLRAVMLSFLYARMYKGKFILRFEDTDPSPGKIRREYYDMIRNDLKYVGALYDEEVIESSHMAMFYEYAEKLIEAGHAYVDFTPAEHFKKLKLRKADPKGRDSSPAENMKAWKGMLSGDVKKGGAVLRFKTSMQDPNPAFRDPAIFRITNAKHPMTGASYCVWPLYNFANAVEDHESGVTHVFRGKEHEHNTMIQVKIYSALGWTPPEFLNFGMIYLPGMKDHTRDIKEKISKGIYSGWDDPRLYTIMALKRRGFSGSAFAEVAVVAGLSKTDIKFSWESLETANRRIIDPVANRYMVVFEPVSISVKGYPHETNFVQGTLHPDFPDRGSKRIHVTAGSISIAKEDWKKLDGKTFRLKGFANVRLSGKSAAYVGDEVAKAMQKIQWVSNPNVRVNLVVPAGEKLEIRKGIGEADMSKLVPGDMIQMERVGFARVDSIGKGKITLYWAHK